MRVLLLFHVGEAPPHLKLMMDSVRKHLPDYYLVHLTDRETAGLAVDEVIRRDRGDTPVFVFRTDHFAHCRYNKWLALDTDVLVKHGVEDVWARNFDVALTTRRKGPCPDTNGVDVTKIYPFNTGVIFSRNRDFWVKCMERMKPPYAQGWYSDQSAVAAVAETLQFHVLVLPGDEFNWTPFTEDEQSEARIVHYKGKRKEWMLRACAS